MNNYTDRLQREALGLDKGQTHDTFLKDIAEPKYPQLECGNVLYNHTQKENQTMFIEGMKHVISNPKIFHLCNKTKEEGITGEDDMLIDFHNFVFRHPNKFLKMGEYLSEWKQTEEYIVRKTSTRFVELLKFIEDVQIADEEGSIEMCARKDEILSKYSIKQEGEDIRKEIVGFIKWSFEKGYRMAGWDESQILSAIDTYLSTLPSTTENKEHPLNELLQWLIDTPTEEHLFGGVNVIDKIKELKNKFNV